VLDVSDEEIAPVEFWLESPAVVNCLDIETDNRASENTDDSNYRTVGGLVSRRCPESSRQYAGERMRMDDGRRAKLLRVTCVV